MAELSRRSGRSVATIKYYLREGLLPPSVRTAINQADYGDEHVTRLRLISTLLDVGGLPISAVKQVLAAIDDDTLPLHDALGLAHHGLTRATLAQPLDADVLASAEDVDAFIESLGWRVSGNAPARIDLAETLASLRRLGWDVDATVFARYAEAAHALAAWELEQLPTSESRSRTAESVVVGTVVFERAFIALRRLTQEHHSANRFS